MVGRAGSLLQPSPQAPLLPAPGLLCHLLMGGLVAAVSLQCWETRFLLLPWLIIPLEQRGCWKHLCQVGPSALWPAPRCSAWPSALQGTYGPLWAIPRAGTDGVLGLLGQLLLSGYAGGPWAGQGAGWLALGTDAHQRPAWVKVSAGSSWL